MNKKTYIVPDMDIVMLKYNSQLLAGSGEKIDEYPEYPDEYGAPVIIVDDF